ncbi:nuclear transport factor 2 family protein [Solimonas sp. SE-A11]|uniref:nuclear transport factor 2 family protein n=1 Tax=Solimonas sp. SE-A11 TaxID=3054954 RepID=UPI00259CDC52|nr:nuclear transport factor 2 family protein [Solimonas sp. SE-A11]MDM4769954.1 nuclear transport factor 2 family protein [Solimonas sp. SE-A11]
MTDVDAQVRDRVALQDLAVEYANAIDARQWHRLDQVFLPDARIDYSATGGIDAPYPEIKPWLAKSLSFFRRHMHLMGNFHFEISGDQATGQVACYNPMVIRNLLGIGTRTVVFGIWYHDRYVRSEQGWRIASRRQELCYTLNMPLWMRIGRYLYVKLQARARRRLAVSPMS